MYEEDEDINKSYEATGLQSAYKLDVSSITRVLQMILKTILSCGNLTYS